MAECHSSTFTYRILTHSMVCPLPLISQSKGPTRAEEKLQPCYSRNIFRIRRSIPAMGIVCDVQYVDKATSDQLLDKFSDISIYGFDYLQSGIWSPLRPVYNVSADVKTSKKKKKKHRHQLVNGSHRFLRQLFVTSRPPFNCSVSSASAHKVLDQVLVLLAFASFNYLFQLKIIHYNTDQSMDMNPNLF